MHSWIPLIPCKSMAVAEQGCWRALLSQKRDLEPDGAITSSLPGCCCRSADLEASVKSMMFWFVGWLIVCHSCALKPISSTERGLDASDPSFLKAMTRRTTWTWRALVQVDSPKRPIVWRSSEALPTKDSDSSEANCERCKTMVCHGEQRSVKCSFNARSVEMERAVPQGYDELDFSSWPFQCWPVYLAKIQCHNWLAAINIYQPPSRKVNKSWWTSKYPPSSTIIDHQPAFIPIFPDV